MFRKILPFALCLIATAASAQDSAKTEKYIELLRSDWKTDRVAIVTEAMDLNDQQGASFWPIYREYDAALTALNDERLNLIRDYGNQLGTLDDKGAKDLMKRAFKLRDERNDLLEKYAGKVEKAIGGRAAARWAQTEAALHSLIDIALASELPLVE
jgi:hypothetical protein